MAKIFVCYRRDDSGYAAGIVFEALATRFDRANVFFDVDTIPPGVDFRKYLDEAVGRCNVVVALMGRSWIAAVHEHGPLQGSRRLDDPKDFVRIELESALARGIPVVPVLLDRAAIPLEAELPASLRELAYRNAVEIRPGRDLRIHVDRFVDDIARLIEESASTTPAQPAAAPSSSGPLAPASPLPPAELLRLRLALGADDVHVPEAALSKLVRDHSAPAAEALYVDALQDIQNRERRGWALDGLFDLGAPAAEWWRRLLSHEDDRVVAEALYALTRSAYMLQQEDWDRMLEITAALVEAGGWNACAARITAVIDAWPDSVDQPESRRIQRLLSLARELPGAFPE